LAAAAVPALPGAAGVAGATGTSPAASSTDREVHGTVALPSGGPRNTGPILRCAAEAVAVLGAAGTVITTVQPGSDYSLKADAGTWAVDFDIAFYAGGPVCTGTSPAPRLSHRNFGGDEFGVVPAGATFAVVSLLSVVPNQAFTYREFTAGDVGYRPTAVKPTVVAVVEPVVVNPNGPPNGFSPYHLDFSGAEHPWNNDASPDNDIDFTADPSSWLPGYPGADPVQLTVPTTPDQDVTGLAAGPDKAAWASMQASDSNNVHLYRLTGTKIVGAAAFAFNANSVIQLDHPNIYGDDNLKAHGTHTSSVSAGNINGSCPECVLVLLRGDAEKAVKWAAAQPWIDVITNSYSAAAGVPREDRAFDDVVRNAVVGGQTVAWSSGNGTDGSNYVPGQSYGDHRTGSDWVVTVGGVEPISDQADGSSRPADVVSYDAGYPAAGGTTAGGKDLFDGTSNSAPVVAGTFAEALLRARMLLGDATPGHAGGVVAEGPLRPCDNAAVASCPLADGVLTRAELQAAVFGALYPSPLRTDAVVPTGAANAITYNGHSTLQTPSYIPQGHGIVHGRLGDERYGVETRSIADLLRGAVAPGVRPPGERAWLTSDSLCRQRFWGEWDGGYYHHGDAMPAFDLTTEAPAAAWWGLCTNLPQYFGEDLSPE
jgi:hypothetical protein